MKQKKQPIKIPSLSIELIPEVKFHPTRKWRADYCVDYLGITCKMPKILIEIDGGIWTGGRHSGGTGQIKDMEKLNAAAILGYRVLRYTPQQFAKGQHLIDLKEML
jgi:very-short-patch-repair endonuclease